MKTKTGVLVGLACVMGFLLPHSASGAGVTIVTHGFQFPLTFGAPDWVLSMANEVSHRAGSAYAEVTLYRMTVERMPDKSVQLSSIMKIAGPNPSDSETGEIIILLDWSNVAGTPFSVPTGLIAELAFPALTNRNAFPGLGGALVELPIHLIGHSRGSSVVLELARRLGQSGVWVDQVTTLDPHPVESFEDAPIRLWENIRFADNYWRADGLQVTNPSDVDGQYVEGAFDGDLNSIVQNVSLNGQNINEHILVHAYYHGTINGTASSDQIAAGQDYPSPILGAWFQPPSLSRTDTGFRYSRIGRGVRPSSGLAVARVAREPLSNRVPDSEAWDDVEIEGLLNDRVVPEGTAFSIEFYFEDRKGDATITWGYDNDRNPYNGTIAVEANLATSGIYFQPYPRVYSSVPIPAGTHNIFAKISDGTRTRYYYAPGTVTVVPQTQPDAPSIVITSPTSGATWTIGRSSVFLRGVASSTTSQVTWRSITTGDQGAATGTETWNSGSISLEAGFNEIRVTASDAQGRTATDTIGVTYSQDVRTITLDASECSFIASGSPNKNYSSGLMFVGYDSDSSVRNERILVKFNDLALVPAGSSIQSASLQFYNWETYPSSAPGINVTANRMTTEWGENTVTWNNQPPHTSSGGASADVGTATGPYSWDVTSIVNGWWNGSFADHGFKLVSSIENATARNDRAFGGRQNTENPLLKINYLPETEPPTIIIINPIPQLVTRTVTGSISVNGTANDNYGIASVSWANTTSGMSGNAQGTTNWEVLSLPLVPGANTLVFTARDAAGNASSSELFVEYRPPSLVVAPGQIEAELTEGTNTQTVTLQLWNGGYGAFEISVEESIPWLTISQSTAILTGQVQQVTVQFSSAGLPVGIYEETLTIRGFGANNSPLSVSVVMTVTENRWSPYVPTQQQAELSVLPGVWPPVVRATLTFSTANFRVKNWGQAIQEGETITANAEFEVFNTSGLVLPAIVEVSNDYRLSTLPSDQYSFVLKAWGETVKTLNFLVQDNAPRFSTPPPVQIRGFEGEDINLSVSAESADSIALGYQWHFEGVDLPYGTGSTLVLTNVTLSQTGIYRLTVTNLYGSAEAAIRVDVGVALLIPPTAELVQLIKTDGFALDAQLTIGRRYRVENSTNLVNWFALTNFTATQSAFQWVDIHATNSPWRFYRVVSDGFDQPPVGNGQFFDTDCRTLLGPEFKGQVYVSSPFQAGSFTPYGSPEELFAGYVPSTFGLGHFEGYEAGQTIYIQVKVWEAAKAENFESLPLANPGKVAVTPVFSIINPAPPPAAPGPPLHSLFPNMCVHPLR